MNEYRLVVAEKPSVAKSIAAVLGAKERQDGFYLGNGYLVSWCFGHLAELAEADAYDEKYSKWRYEDLPILPEPWQYSVSRDKGKQLHLLNTLMHREDVAEVINACDAGREGELIFRTAYKLNRCDKPMKRLWISSMEDEAIRQGFENLRDGCEYDHLYAAALCRSKADWLVGINATRLFSVLYHRTLNVGRVLSPTLALLVQREAEISAFTPEPFYTVVLRLPGFEAASEKLKNKADAEALMKDCSGNTAVVKGVERKEKREKASRLYDLTTLQRDANRILGYTAQQTLDYLQALYEKKLCTYPRTDSRYLTGDMLDKVTDIAAVASKIAGMELGEVNPGQVCDSKQVSDHHAIVPTVTAAGADLASLPVGEQEILKLVSRQVLCAVCSPYVYAETTVTLDCGGKTFTTTGKAALSMGWKAYLEQEPQEKALPDVCGSMRFPVEDASVKEGQTAAPRHFTEDTLLSSMEIAGAKEMPNENRVPAKSNDFVGEGGATERSGCSPSGGRSEAEFATTQRKGLGTPATRAAILEKLVASGLVERKKSKKAVSLIPTHSGVSLITVLPEQLQSPLLTAEWEQRLKNIEKGLEHPEAFMQSICELVKDLVANYQVIRGAEVLFPSGRTVVGKCPRCGGEVTESRNGYFCERNDCRFGLWRDNKYLTCKKITLTKKMVTALLRDGKAFVSGIYSEKTGKTYDAFVCLEDDGIRSSYRLEFWKDGGRR